jgi:hypothetical protein
MTKATIIVSSDADDTFTLTISVRMSDGWYTIDKRHTKRAQHLMRLAKDTIKQGENVLHTIELLQTAGFKIRTIRRS